MKATTTSLTMNVRRYNSGNNIKGDRLQQKHGTITLTTMSNFFSEVYSAFLPPLQTLDCSSGIENLLGNEHARLELWKSVARFVDPTISTQSLTKRGRKTLVEHTRDNRVWTLLIDSGLAKSCMVMQKLENDANNVSIGGNQTKVSRLGEGCD
ncbi:hypothetical protein M5K25_015636 [Dendrobium thyrsiflorum]|uniref:Uncharacterized protein n=1 Tax=Dendrobium thyrsiflorum TaxID=117978 RepID=A0ABD0URN1_DENTH